ncbi:L-proline glycine betaine ABC transport system permease protein ProW (TC 3.A.1.12.1) [Alloactinosynnema sp. L-07]|uniref:ABC transporter permease n=1 Tax=Alloactinosynnema sp. L-07 TaxID=1653480 RepID=UPI00065EF14A|nr:ABC transporter permease subunit [Alloactinosynnema sp. L-07]CRK59665.1 L-proline glycine betaine ABC transport system permease protein ProW (TC 3.A.1.12.1) [Alloactinosynnema sp. L-07]
MIWVFDHLAELLSLSGYHLWLALLPLAVGLLIALPLGWVASRYHWARVILVPAAGLLYTIPSLALFVLMPLVLGTLILDPLNVQIALTLYTVALLVRVVADALAAVPATVAAAATAMGYRPVGRFFAVDLPLALPVLLAGVRVAAVSNISLVSVGSLIGVHGLGQALTEGFQRDNYAQIIAGIVLIVLLALAIDAILVLVGRVMTPWARIGGRR